MPGLVRMHGRSRFGATKARASRLLAQRARSWMAGTSPAMMIRKHLVRYRPEPRAESLIHSVPATCLNPHGNMPILLIKGCQYGPRHTKVASARTL
ncbi:hypothetical protein DCM80_13055 [Bradyrhizobium sp. WBOS08]|nr:hypothetical protein DCM80_13055 [Bradyrhizobium sp. WBOS08]